jgi:hypothetical protein
LIKPRPTRSRRGADPLVSSRSELLGALAGRFAMPANLVQQGAKLKLFINAKAARALGIIVPLPL